jgi:hypothetical protein
MKDFKLTLNVNEMNLIIRALGNLPYNQVNELLNKIHAQAQEQLTAANGQEATAVLESNRSN